MNCAFCTWLKKKKMGHTVCDKCLRPYCTPHLPLHACTNDIDLRNEFRV